MNTDIPTHPHAEFNHLRRNNTFLELQASARRRWRRQVAIRTAQTITGLVAVVGACYLIVTAQNPAGTLAVVGLTVVATGTLSPVVSSWIYRP